MILANFRWFSSIFGEIRQCSAKIGVFSKIIRILMTNRHGRGEMVYPADDAYGRLRYTGVQIVQHWTCRIHS
jgi:hypothetical protein